MSLAERIKGSGLQKILVGTDQPQSTDHSTKEVLQLDLQKSLAKDIEATEQIRQKALALRQHLDLQISTGSLRKDETGEYLGPVKISQLGENGQSKSLQLNIGLKESKSEIIIDLPPIPDKEPYTDFKVRIFRQHSALALSSKTILTLFDYVSTITIPDTKPGIVERLLRVSRFKAVSRPNGSL